MVEPLDNVSNGALLPVLPEARYGSELPEQSHRGRDITSRAGRPDDLRSRSTDQEERLNRGVEQEESNLRPGLPASTLFTPQNTGRGLSGFAIRQYLFSESQVTADSFNSRGQFLELFV